MKTRMRLDDYIPVLLKKRKHEERKKVVEPSEGLTSPLGATSTEEIRIFSEYMAQANLLRITEAVPEKKKFYC